MKKIYYFLVFFGALFFWVFGVSTPHIFAQQMSLGISPPLLETIIKPGKTIMVAYRLDNFADPAVVTAKILPFTPYDIDGKLKIKKEFEGPIQFSLENADVQLNSPFLLESNKSQQALLKIRIPEGTPEGDYYYTFIFETKPPIGFEGNSNSNTKASIGSNILLTVSNSGNIEIKGGISDFRVIPTFTFSILGKEFSFFESSDKIPVILTLENKGKNFIKPYGNISYNLNSKEQKKYTLLPQNILGESKRTIIATPSAQINCTNNEKMCKLNPSLIIDGFHVGKYNLSLSVNFGEDTPTHYMNISFIAIPLKIIIGTILCIIIIYFLIKKVKITVE